MLDETAFVEIRNDKIISYFDVNHSVDDPNDFRPPRYMKVQKPLRNCAVTYDPNTKMLNEDTIDYPHPTPEIKQAWLDYRQSLRDLPSNTEDPTNPVWPTPPN